MDAGELISKLNHLVPGAIVEKGRLGRRGPVFLWIEVRSILPVAQALKTESSLRLDWLENLSVAQAENALMISYFIRSFLTDRFLVLRASVALPSDPNQEISLPSVVSVWPMSQPFEHEAAEFFGVQFTPEKRDLTRPWGGFPMRKTFKFPSVVSGFQHRREKVQ